MNRIELWKRYQRYLCRVPEIGLSLDVSRMNFDDAFLEHMRTPLAEAFEAMVRLEGGAKANADEDRMVGHYWLRSPELAPSPEITRDIQRALQAVENFAGAVHSGTIRPQQGDAFDILLCIGIGGSSLGPQLIADALGGLDDMMLVRFMDNTDPEGIRRTLGEIEDSLDQTLTLVTSKSGATPETRNGMLEAASAYHRRGLSFPRHAAAITVEGSALHRQATHQHWLAAFPLWDWVGGRTSVFSAAGLLPAALLGFDTAAFLGGARKCDLATREKEPIRNPAAMLALMWHYAGQGRGNRNMVILPYADRLQLLGRYLQQLVMESLGKERDRRNNIVHQGLTVFGNKGSTDQHSFVQQLREGRNDFFATFVEVLAQPQEEQDAAPTGDFLQAFLHGTRAALTANGRESIGLTLDRLDAERLGALIALFERAVGLYAELIDVNAYNQPGVEAGKKAAQDLLGLQERVLALLEKEPRALTAEEIAAALGEPDRPEDILHILQRAALLKLHGIIRQEGPDFIHATFRRG